MKKAKKVLALLLCAVLLVGASVAGTLAYLTAQDTVTNTFTVGNVVITMDEAKVDLYGVVEQGKDRVEANTYKLIPGRTYTKDPTIHVDANSESCWLFAKIEMNGLDTVGSINIDGTKWVKVDTNSEYWAYQSIVSGGADVNVFSQYTCNAKETHDTLAAYEDKQIVVTAYAIQSDGIATVADAWSAVAGQLELD